MNSSDHFTRYQLALWAVGLAALVASQGCASDLGDDPTDAGTLAMDAATDAPSGESPNDRVSSTVLADGSTETVVDAQLTEDWVWFDLETGSALASEDDSDWDVALQRYHFRVNGGANGSADVAVAILVDTSLAEVSQAPSEGYLQDVEGEDGVEYVISAGDDPWWNYDSSTHVLTAKERVYVVRSGAGQYYALQIVDYYSATTGDSGYPTFQWKAIDPPEGEEPGLAIDASGDDWVYLDFAGDVVTDADSTDWDLAFNGVGIRTNSGVSGPGVGGALEVLEGVFLDGTPSWDEISAAPTVGYTVDATIAGPTGGETDANEALSAWYDYDTSTHAVSPGEHLYLVRGATGDYAKLRILAWDGGVFRVQIETVQRLVQTHSEVISATESGVCVHFSLRTGRVETIDEGEDAGVNLAWDIAFARTAVRTNSGTSGAGAGGAAEASSAELEAIDSTDATYTVDTDVPVAGPSGDTVSGNEVLGGWYDYDTTTHAVSPGERAYLVRTADGGFAKVRITSWSDGELGLDWAYAGTAQSDFGASE